VTHVSEMTRGLGRGHEAAARAVCHGYAYERGRVLSRAADYLSFRFGSVNVAAVRRPRTMSPAFASCKARSSKPTHSPKREPTG
jgi:hypothetical protein